MIYSMTGFAAAAQEVEQGTINLELRSVNHRYLEIMFRLDEQFRALEPALRELIGARLTRGKVDCRLSFAARHDRPDTLQLNAALVGELVQLSHVIQAKLPGCAPMGAADVLRWPGVVVGETLSAEALREPALALLQTALDDLSATRGREGQKTADMLLDRVAQMEVLVTQVAPHIPKLVAAHQEKLATRLREAIGSADDDRIRQELALFAQKIDVDEELSRLQTHLGEVKRILSKGGAVGKRLDFLMQELNREANTLGSKSVATEVSQVSMELKVLIEQMREQIQNVE
jgi:uncharacterized protein (TIGR00255 family)